MLVSAPPKGVAAILLTRLLTCVLTAMVLSATCLAQSDDDVREANSSYAHLLAVVAEPEIALVSMDIDSGGDDESTLEGFHIPVYKEFAVEGKNWHWQNRYGYMDNHHRHDLRLNGYVLLPLDFTIAVNAGWRSAFRWTPQKDQHDIPEMLSGYYFTEPRGNREGADYAWLDLQISKGFRIGPTHLDLIVSVLNAFSQEQVTGVCDMVRGCGDFDLGEAIDWNTPRAWEVGFRLTF